MRYNRVREIFNSDELLLDTRMHSPWGNEIDMIGCTALNTVQVVAEYGALETLDFENLCRAAEANNLGKSSSLIALARNSAFRGQSAPDLKPWFLWTCTIAPRLKSACVLFALQRRRMMD